MFKSEGFNLRLKMTSKFSRLAFADMASVIFAERRNKNLVYSKFTVDDTAWWTSRRRRVLSDAN